MLSFSYGTRRRPSGLLLLELVAAGVAGGCHLSRWSAQLHGPTKQPAGSILASWISDVQRIVGGLRQLLLRDTLLSSVLYQLLIELFVHRVEVSWYSGGDFRRGGSSLEMRAHLRYLLATPDRADVMVALALFLFGLVTSRKALCIV